LASGLYAEHGMTASINFKRGTRQALLVSFVKQLHNLRHTPLSDSPNFILPKAVWKTVCQISPCQSFPPYGMQHQRFEPSDHFSEEALKVKF